MDATTKALIEAALALPIHARVSGKYEVEYQDLGRFLEARMRYLSAYSATPPATFTPEQEARIDEKIVARLFAFNNPPQSGPAAPDTLTELRAACAGYRQKYNQHPDSYAVPQERCLMRAIDADRAACAEEAKRG